MKARIESLASPAILVYRNSFDTLEALEDWNGRSWCATIGKSRLLFTL